MSIATIFLILAAVSFAVAAFRGYIKASGAISFTDLGFMFVVLAVLASRGLR